MIKIGIGLSFYEDFDSLRRMLQSCQQYPIDLIIAVDGRYQGYRSSSKLSTQECRDLFRSFQTPYVLVDAPDLNQNEKRQIYFDGAKDLDVLIVMDTDEYFLTEKTHWPLFVEELEQKIKENIHTWRRGYCIPVLLKNKGIEEMPDDYIENLPRVFSNPSDLMYVDDHFTIRNRYTGVMMTFQEPQLLHNIAMGHDHTLRTNKYKAATREYEDKLIEYENLHRQQRQDEFSSKLGSMSR